jgi:hypothetical protein
MSAQQRLRLSYANVMSTLAVFIALGGSAYAARINGAALKNRSVAGVKLKPNSLGPIEIRESRLRRVPRAKTADRVGDDLTAPDIRAMLSSLRLRCPSDTLAISDICLESVPRPAAPYGSAVLTCGNYGIVHGLGRRLPTHGELTAGLTEFRLAAGGELTSEVYPSSTYPGRLDALWVAGRSGEVVGLAPDVAVGAKQYRCVADPIQ